MLYGKDGAWERDYFGGPPAHLLYLGAQVWEGRQAPALHLQLKEKILFKCLSEKSNWIDII